MFGARDSIDHSATEATRVINEYRKWLFSKVFFPLLALLLRSSDGYHALKTPPQSGVVASGAGMRGGRAVARTDGSIKTLSSGPSRRRGGLLHNV